MLLSRDYYHGVIDAAIAKARAIPRTQALRRVPRHTDQFLWSRTIQGCHL